MRVRLWRLFRGPARPTKISGTNCVKRPNWWRILRFASRLCWAKNSEEEVPSLVCCWDRREDSRTRTKWQSHRKTQRQKDLQDGLAEFVHWANYSHDHRGKSNEYLSWEYVMWWKSWKECGNVPTSSTGCLNKMQTSSHDNMVKGWDPQNPRNCSNKTWIGKAERSERSEKLQKAQLWTQSKPSKLFESLPPVFETLKQEKLSLFHNNSHDKKT